MHLKTLFTLLNDMDRMRSRPESAISEMVATTLIIILVVALAAIIAALILGIPLTPNKPVLAAFSSDVVMGANRSALTHLDVPIIQLYQMAGDPLSQEFTAGTHSTINGTKVKIIDPTGKMYTIVSAQSLTGRDIKKGDSYYIFHFINAGETNQYWLTNNPKRVFSSSDSGVQPFSPRGTWRLVITDEKDTNTILYQKDLVL
jgi:energy-converting hydrogenase Eha subunit A